MERGSETHRLIVPGKPAGAGSKTAFPVKRGDGTFVFKDGRLLLNYAHSSERTAPWMKVVEVVAATAKGSDAPLDGPLWLDVFFYEHRPTTHYFHRKTGRVLRPDAPAYPEATEQHDVDKLRRAISDSLTNAGLIVDDKRIIGGEAWKNFVENVPEITTVECAILRLGRMDFATVEEAGITSPPPVEGQEQLIAA